MTTIDAHYYQSRTSADDAQFFTETSEYSFQQLRKQASSVYFGSSQYFGSSLRIYNKWYCVQIEMKPLWIVGRTNCWSGKASGSTNAGTLMPPGAINRVG